MRLIILQSLNIVDHFEVSELQHEHDHRIVMFLFRIEKSSHKLVVIISMFSFDRLKYQN